ncbi:MAG: hypothetical protein QOF49_861 [Chloroflexota bacterium]|jgi:hypothetical protein|nr:hypothetical protein [Chloroflexota bacterium]
MIREDNSRERDITLRPARPSGGPYDLLTCSGAMSSTHDGRDVRRTELGHLCRPCRDAAGRLGMLAPEVGQ